MFSQIMEQNLIKIAWVNPVLITARRSDRHRQWSVIVKSANGIADNGFWGKMVWRRL
jgi:hypothetical protein